MLALVSFGLAWSGLAQSGTVGFGLTVHTQIYDNLTYLSTTFDEKTLSCI
jgi:hypothetical protein